ncbi:bifunctional metallophosphatase/5'-nucleotidase [Occultella kanbiaonis]|uniref:bifunctional metallophosphatase/5'-nucleotidase n=1 Tax=Occultella kanbiaonis TaxID=2675754 RepID=UPI001B35445B|nr:5'-nucleotidase C-terminal domain-containing protein [Occultella kanbiaonis]
MAHKPTPTSDAKTAHAALLDSEVSRRRLLGMAAVGTAGAAAAGLIGADAAHAGNTDTGGPGRNDAHRRRLTVLGTTDLHGNVFNWDYFKDGEYTDSAGNDIGLAKISTLVSAMRAERGERTTLLLDAGDTIQGTPLAYYYARIDPITGGHVHPMAAAMNAIGYDAAAMGNHEFNYGLDTLQTFVDQLDFPLLCANAVDDFTGEPAYEPYVIHTVRPRGARPIKVGILGLVTPGVAIWDKANVEGILHFPGLVEQAQVFVPRMKSRGADIIIVSAHSGADTSSSYGDALPYPENAATLVAEQVPDIDAILVGHAHSEIVERFVTNTATGKQVLLTEPLRWGMRLSVMDLDLVSERGRWHVESAHSRLLNANSVPEDPAIVEILTADHETVRGYVNSVIGTNLTAMSAQTSRYEDTAAMDFINHVQSDAVTQALAGTPEADLPVLSIAAPFNRDAAIPAGDVTVRDVAGMYIFDNTLLAITLTGAEVLAYLEQSAAYFKQITGTGPFAPDDVTNAVTPTAPNGTPDYNYDIMGGFTAPLTYDIDIAQAPGSRIVGLSYDGAPIDPAQRFVIAINNYRQSGGGNFPGVVAAPVVYNAQVEIRQLIIDWATAVGQIDSSVFAATDWRLVANGAPVIIQA